MLLRNEGKLREAAAEGNVEEFVSLLSDGQVDVNCEVDALKTTPLDQAASRGLTDMVRRLLDMGAEISKANGGGNTPLHGAAYHGRTEVVKLLLERGADADRRGNTGKTPLHSATRKGHREVLQLLLESGAGWQFNKKSSQKSN